MPHPTVPSASPASVRLTRRAALAAIGGAAASMLVAPAWAVDSRRPGALAAPTLTALDRAVQSEVSAARAIEHIAALSEGIGPRIGGTQSEHDAADYLAGVLDEYGYEVELQPFAVADKFLAQISGSPALPDDLDWQAGASAQGGLDMTVTGRVVDIGNTMTDTRGDLRGAVVLLDEAPGRRDTQIRLAERRGAAAIIVLRPDSTYPRQTSASSLRLGTPSRVPVVAVAQSQKHRLREALANGPLTLTVSTVAHRNLTSYNVLANRQGTGADGTRRALMVCGHYDTVIGAPGANDDGSGTALTVEVARVMQGLSTHHDLQFSLWGSEEQGLIGSRYYARGLDQAQRDYLKGVYNNDMVATSWDPASKYWVLSFTGQPNVITSSVIAASERLGYAPQLSPVTQRGASDHQSFQEVGIASANFSWRGEETPALLEPPYHSPEDTIAKNISAERMQVSLELISSALYQTANEV